MFRTQTEPFPRQANHGFLDIGGSFTQVELSGATDTEAFLQNASIRGSKSPLQASGFTCRQDRKNPKAARISRTSARPTWQLTAGYTCSHVYSIALASHIRVATDKLEAEMQTEKTRRGIATPSVLRAASLPVACLCTNTIILRTDFNLHSPDDGLICVTLTPIQI